MTPDRRHKTGLQLAGVVVVMGALAWASVPFYDWFCRVTGFGGVPAVAADAADSGGEHREILDRTIRVRFDGSLARHMPWQFAPVERVIDLRIGETALAYYRAHNPAARPIAGSASFNVLPYSAGSFFTKIDCFCFQEQVLQPGETVLMPVSFYVDPEIVNDREGRHIKQITLSYTFHEIDLPTEDTAALTPFPPPSPAMP